MSDDRRVGYGRPPKNRQFKPGQSGNPGGRPRKKPVGPDAISLLDEDISVREGGAVKSMPQIEVIMHSLVKKAKDGDIRSLLKLLELFERYEAFGDISKVKTRHKSVIVLPASMPGRMSQLLFNRFGEPPWTAAQIAIGREAYLRQRSEKDAKLDDAIGYPDL